MNNITRTVLLAPAALSLLGCQSGPSVKPDTMYLGAAQIPEPPDPAVKEVKVPVPTPQLRRLPSTMQSAAGNGSASPELTLAEAREQATQGPTPDGFIEAVQTYAYLPGAVYEVFASPGRVTTIALRPGEKLIAKAAGDTARWVVGDSHTGSGPDARTLLLVKPLELNVETNLIVSTNERVYQIDLKSLPDTYHSAVRWNYPRALAEQLAERYRTRADADDMVIAQGLDLAELDFGYRVYSGGRAEGERPAPPPWTPQRVFTDGRKTYIAFPKNLATMKAPPLFVLGRKGGYRKPQLVNYRVKGNYYIVDRVIERAELRLGKDPQRIVHIERIGE